MGYFDAYVAARRPAFAISLEMALVKAALDINSEATSTPDHVARATFAKAVLKEPARWTDVIKNAVSVQGVTDTSTDQDFYNAVSAIWNGYTG